MYLVASESSAMESDVPWEEQPSSGNNSAKGVNERIKSVRPLCVEHATGAPQPAVEHSLFVAGSGNGAEVESAAPKPQTREKKPRPRTAKCRRNRISPSPVTIERGSPLQPWATASLSRLSRLIRSYSGSTASVNSQDSSDHSPERF